MKRRILAFVAVSLLLCLSIQAIDHDAKMIDSVKLTSADYDYADITVADIWVENCVDSVTKDFSIIANLGMGHIKYNSTFSDDYWKAGIGVRYYLSRVTSGAIYLDYSDFGSDFTLMGANLKVVQRLRVPSAAISPYIVGIASLQTIDNQPLKSMSGAVESFDELVIAVGGGCDFMMNDTFALVFEGIYSESEETSSNGSDMFDGWAASLAFKYYWD